MIHLLRQQCLIYTTPQSIDMDGNIEWGQPACTACRFVRTGKRYKDNQGNEIELTGQFQISQCIASVGTRVEHNGRSYKVVDVQDWVDGAGNLFGSLLKCQDWPDSDFYTKPDEEAI